MCWLISWRPRRRCERLPLNVAIVLDRSGSMGDDRKFTLAREAIQQALDMLRPEDRCSLVVYDTQIDVLTPSSFATAEVKHATLTRLENVGPRGGTDLGGGWLRGCEQVAEFLENERVSRCLLLTDGLANHGITDRDALAHHAGELRRRGVVTSTFGVGADFDERLLRDMAHEGGGSFSSSKARARFRRFSPASLAKPWRSRCETSRWSFGPTATSMWKRSTDFACAMMPSVAGWKLSWAT